MPNRNQRRRLAQTPQSPPTPSPPTVPPSPCWQQNTMVWGCVSLALGIVFTVIAAMAKDVRWLLTIALPFFVFAVWETARSKKHPAPKLWAAFSVAPLATALGAIYLDLAPETKDVQSSTAAKTELNSNRAATPLVPFYPTPQAFLRQLQPRADAIAPVAALPHSEENAAKGACGHISMTDSTFTGWASGGIRMPACASLDAVRSLVQGGENGVVMEDHEGSRSAHLAVPTRPQRPKGR